MCDTEERGLKCSVRIGGRFRQNDDMGCSLTEHQIKCLVLNDAIYDNSSANHRSQSRQSDNERREGLLHACSTCRLQRLDTYSNPICSFLSRKWQMMENAAQLSIVSLLHSATH